MTFKLIFRSTTALTVPPPLDIEERDTVESSAPPLPYEWPEDEYGDMEDDEPPPSPWEW
jgi:hypothetical protein